MFDFTVKDLSLLEPLIRASGSVTGMYTDMDFSYLKSLDLFNKRLAKEKWRKTPLELTFTDLPLYINKNIYENLWVMQIWGTPVIKWRLQIGK